jgi:Condensation domain
MSSTVITRRPRDHHPIPVSPLQQVWLNFETEVGAPFNIPIAAEIRGPLDTSTLERVLSLLVARHETLRTTFVSIGGLVHQVIAEPASVHLHVELVADLSEAELRAHERRLVQFDLRVEQPFRAHLYRTASGEHLLLLVTHHVAVDEWSLGVLWEELWIAYDAMVEGRSPELLPHPIDFVDFAAWHQAQSSRLQVQLDKWRRYVGTGVPVLDLPLDRPWSTTPMVFTESQFQIPGHLATSIVELARSRGASPWMAYFAAFQAMLYRVTKQTDFGVLTPTWPLLRHQRGNLVGPLLNLIFIRADVSGNPSFYELLSRVARSAFETLSCRLVPWSWIQQLAPPRGTGVPRHAQVNFQIMETGSTSRPTKIDATQRFIDRKGLYELGMEETFQLAYSLRVHLSEAGIADAGLVEYRADLFDSSTIDRFAREFIAVLEHAVADPSAPLG